MKKITIIGATGTLGPPIVRKLVEKGAQVKAIVRNPLKAKKLLPEAVELVQGDVFDKSSLERALKGSETVYLNLNTTDWKESKTLQPEREGIINVVDVSKALGVQHLMQIVGIDSSHPEFATTGMEYLTNRIRKPAMDHLMNSGLHYTFFHCSVFLDSFPSFIQGQDFGIIGQHKYPVFFTNTSDLAENIFQAIGNEKAYNRAFTVQGLEGISFPEAARRFVGVYAPEVQVSEYPMETIRHIGLPDKEAEDFMEHMLSYVEQLKEEQVSALTWEILGKPKHSIESFAKTLVS